MTARKQVVPMRMAGSHGVPFYASKGRPSSDEIAGVPPSSIMNVAKVVQPTATVSSVPVSGPTTGIPRFVPAAQNLRQQASAPNDAGGSNSTPHKGVAWKSIVNAPSGMHMIAPTAESAPSLNTDALCTTDPHAAQPGSTEKVAIPTSPIIIIIVQPGAIPASSIAGGSSQQTSSLASLSMSSTISLTTYLITIDNWRNYL